jgi:hypothetical protein
VTLFPDVAVLDGDLRLPIVVLTRDLRLVEQDSPDAANTTKCDSALCFDALVNILNSGGTTHELWVSFEGHQKGWLLN